MFLEIDATNRITERAALRAMFEARKRVFIDLLKWDIPALDGRYEVDQFDDDQAVYLILLDAERRHLASARLLPTTRPGILSGLYPDLCSEAPPAGESIYEITRFCLSRDVRADVRRDARNMLVTALARYALAHGITAYTGVAEKGWLEQIMGFGWKCAPLGPPVRRGAQHLGALRIDITRDTLARLKHAGVHAELDPAFIYTRAA